MSKNIREILLDFKAGETDAKIISYLALLTAFVAIATFLYIPGPSSSYFNLGEVAIYLIAITFGQKVGAITGALGSSLVDIILGYSIWAPFTLVIKGLEGWVVGKIARENNILSKILAILVGGHIMIFGYAITKGFLISWAAVFTEIGINYAQVIIGAVVAIPLSRQIKRYFDTK
ncbi:MAG: ECF transporter S component [Halanaerobiales bacterium]